VLLAGAQAGVCSSSAAAAAAAATGNWAMSACGSLCIHCFNNRHLHVTQVHQLRPLAGHPHSEGDMVATSM
jgi:hypothetical protein